MFMPGGNVGCVVRRSSAKALLPANANASIWSEKKLYSALLSLASLACSDSRVYHAKYMAEIRTACMC